MLGEKLLGMHFIFFSLYFRPPSLSCVGRLLILMLHFISTAFKIIILCKIIRFMLSGLRMNRYFSAILRIHFYSIFFIEPWPESEDRIITGSVIIKRSIFLQKKKILQVLLYIYWPQKIYFVLTLVRFFGSAGQNTSCSDYHVSWSKLAKVGLVPGPV